MNKHQSMALSNCEWKTCSRSLHHQPSPWSPLKSMVSALLNYKANESTTIYRLTVCRWHKNSTDEQIIT